MPSSCPSLRWAARRTPWTEDGRLSGGGDMVAAAAAVFVAVVFVDVVVDVELDVSIGCEDEEVGMTVLLAVDGGFDGENSIDRVP